MRLDKAAFIGVVVLTVGIGVAVVATDDDENNEPNRDGQSTPYEAACDMLEDGDTAVEAFDILVEFDVTELEASRAVNEAIADGCG